MGKKQRVLVTGSRDYKRKGMIDATLTGLLSNHFFGDFTLIQGGAQGADLLAKNWAIPMLENVDHTQKDNVIHWKGTIEMYQVNAEWELYDRWVAGPRRNTQMLEYEPTLCLAFKDNFDPTMEHGGTENMCMQAMDAGIPTYLIQKLELPSE